MADFLLEIGLEEVPARMIAAAEAELGKRVNDLLTRERLLDEWREGDDLLDAAAAGCAGRGRAGEAGRHRKSGDGPVVEDRIQRRRADGRGRGLCEEGGRGVAELKKIETPKGEYVGATVKRAGRTASEILAADLPKEVLGLYWAKNMYWRAGKPERFVRPVRWVVALLDAKLFRWRLQGSQPAMRAAGIACCMAMRPVVIACGERLRGDSARGERCCRCGRAPADHPQGAGCGDANGCGRALARG